MERCRGVRSWLREQSYARWQKPGAIKDLGRLGFDADILNDLRAPDLMRLARWITPPQNWADRAAYFGMSLLLVLVVIDASPEPYSGGFLLVLLLGGSLGLVITLASRALVVWLNGNFDYYDEFGQSGGRIIRALTSQGSGELSRKEKAIRAAHAWSRTGRRGGVIFEHRRARVFALLGQTPLDSRAAEEICDNVRSTMLDAVVGKVDPEEYQEPRRLWREREYLESLNLRIAVLVALVGLLATAGFWPTR